MVKQDLDAFLMPAAHVLTPVVTRTGYPDAVDRHPYRDAWAPEQPSSEARGEERILYGALVGIGAPLVAIAAFTGGMFGTQSTIGLLMALGGATGLAATFRR
jgi:hypothetical protein